MAEPAAPTEVTLADIMAELRSLRAAFVRQSSQPAQAPRRSLPITAAAKAMGVDQRTIRGLIAARRLTARTRPGRGRTGTVTMVSMRELELALGSGDTTGL